MINAGWGLVKLIQKPKADMGSDSSYSESKYPIEKNVDNANIVMWASFIICTTKYVFSDFEYSPFYYFP